MLKNRAGPLVSLARRAKREVSWGRVWTIIRLRAKAKGFTAQDLGRARQYGRTGWGLEKPRYEHDLQRPPGYFPGLTAKTARNSEDFPWTAKLEEAFPTIRDEALRARHGAHKHQQDLVETGWNVLYFYSAGRKVDDGHKACPQTAELLTSIPGIGTAGQVHISILAPGTHIKPHCGPTNTRLRCHLGLSVPDGCRIRTGSEIQQWREGKCLVFDDSFEHEVWHEGDEERIVLILDVWHPELSAAEIWAITEMKSRSSAYRTYWRRSFRKT
jgi:Aspartyl/Asparaginyl beta-hydroxylase